MINRNNSNNTSKNNLVITVLLLVLLTISSNAFSQTTGDYRSNGNVNFTSASNWQMYNGSQWVNAATVPPLSSGVTTVTNYTVIDASINIAGTLNIGATVNSSNNPTINVTGNLNIYNGSGLYLTGNVNVLSAGTMTINGQFNFSGGNLNISGNFIVSATGQNYCSGNVIVLAGGILANNNIFQSGTYLEINGTLQTNGASFYNGGNTIVKNGGLLDYNQDGNSGSIPVATWNTGSTLKISGIVGTVPQYLNQSFYNLTWDCASQGQDFNLYDVITNINGSLSISNTNGKNLQFFNYNSNTLNVSGDLNISGNSKVVLGGGGTNKVVLNVSGNYTQSNGTLDIGYSNNGFNLKGNFTSSGGKVIRSLGSGKINFNGVATQYFTSTNPGETSNGVNFEVARNSTLVLNTDMKVLGNNANTNSYIYGKLDLNNHNISMSFYMEIYTTGILKTGTGIISTPDASLNDFKLDDGGTIYIGSPNGITTSGQTGNIQLKGNRTFGTGANYIYNGTANQVTGNGLPSVISGNLTIQSGQELAFSTNETVSGTINLTSGLINMGANTLILSNSAINSLAFTSGYVSGKFQRAIAGNTTGQYLFPLGVSSSLSRVLTLNILTGTSTAGNITTEFNSSDAGGFSVPLNDNGYTVDTYSKEGYWKLTPVTITGMNYKLSLEAKSIGGVQNPASLRILERIASVWSVQGTHVNGTGIVSDPTANRTGLTLFGDYVIAGNSSENTLTGTLPVEMKSFTSGVKDNSVNLNWSTTSEINNLGFDIERTDNINTSWSKIGFVKGNGTSTHINNYNFSDTKLQTGKYHYRLKQVDFNGNFEYYNLQNEISISTPDKFNLSQNFPNPFNPATKIEFQISNQSDVNLTVFDISGRLVSTLVNKNLQAGYYKIEFDGSKLSSGTYFYTLKADNNVSVKKMVLVK